MIFLLLLLLPPTLAHFPLVDKAHGGPIFHNITTALNLTDITRSQFTDRVQMCDYPYLWLQFHRPANFNTLMVGATAPVIERFKDTGVAIVVIGRGLPSATATQAEIDDVCGYSTTGRKCVSSSALPQEVSRQIPTDMGAVGIPAANSSTCAFGEDPLTISSESYVTSSGGDDVKFAVYSDWGGETHCFFHEEFGGSDVWIVQDKLIDLRGSGKHYIVYWVPGDGKIGAPTAPAKFGAVCGDVGQSEDFRSQTVEAGECSLPRQDFDENDCHGETEFRKWLGQFVDSLPLPEDVVIPWNLVGGAPCRPSFAVSIPNAYTCPDKSEGKKCNQLCHNHGFCPAGNTATCDVIATEKSGCGETCHWQDCGKGAVGGVVKGPVGPGCEESCKKECEFLIFNCREVCDLPSPECRGVYKEHEDR